MSATRPLNAKKHSTLNPIYWQESIHQRRSGPKRWFPAFMGRALPFAALIMILIGVPLTLTSYYMAVENTRDLALVVAWCAETVVAVRAIIIGANMISREHINLTWDSLVLTGLSARQILYGKWAGGMRRAAPWLVGLTMIRLVMLPVLLETLTYRLAYYFAQRLISTPSSATFAGEIPFNYNWYLLPTLLAVGATILLCLLEVAGCVAIGILASAISRRGGVALALGLLIRFLPVVVLALSTRYEYGPVTVRWYRLSTFSYIDAGVSPVYQYMIPVSPWTQDRYTEAAPSLIIAIGISVGYFVVSMYGALLLIRFTGALRDKRFNWDQRLATYVMRKLREYGPPDV